MVSVQSEEVIVGSNSRALKGKDETTKTRTITKTKRMTVIWHMDNLLVSCEDNFELTKFPCYLTGIYRLKLVMHTGMKHDYLGMDLEFMANGTLEVSMYNYVDAIIDDFLELVKGKCPTPTAEHLFKVQEANKAKPLPKEQAIAFHHSVTQLMFLHTCTRRDIQVAVLFLTT